jgi:hypothetical protein
LQVLVVHTSQSRPLFFLCIVTVDSVTFNMDYHHNPSTLGNAAVRLSQRDLKTSASLLPICQKSILQAIHSITKANYATWVRHCASGLYPAFRSMATRFNNQAFQSASTACRLRSSASSMPTCKSPEDQPAQHPSESKTFEIVTYFTHDMLIPFIDLEFLILA